MGWGCDYDESLAELRWISRRGPVRQAQLGLVPEAARVVISCLGRWASSLRELVLWTTAEGGPSLKGIWGGLVQLTFLRLSVTVPATAGVRGVSGLARLRALTWWVDVDKENQEPPQLPLPPRLQHLQVSDEVTKWGFPAQMSALAGLQTLVLQGLPHEAVPAMGELPALTALELISCDIQGLLPGLSRCTGLRHGCVWGGGG